MTAKLFIRNYDSARVGRSTYLAKSEINDLLDRRVLYWSTAAEVSENDIIFDTPRLVRIVTKYDNSPSGQVGSGFQFTAIDLAGNEYHGFMHAHHPVIIVNPTSLTEAGWIYEPEIEETFAY